MPRPLEGNPCLYSPGVKWDVQPGSSSHLTELFGPVLGVMQVKNLDQALEFIRQTGYGLTAGLESLDDREQSYWCDRVSAGNLYVNRGTDGSRRAPPTVWRHGQVRLWPRHQGRWTQLRGPAHGLPGRRARSRVLRGRRCRSRRIPRAPATAESARRVLAGERTFRAS